MRELHFNVDAVLREDASDYLSELMLPLRTGAHIEDCGDAAWELISFREWSLRYQAGLVISFDAELGDVIGVDWPTA